MNTMTLRSYKNSSVQKHFVTGLFTDKESVAKAYRAAIRRGFDRRDINIIMSEETKKEFYTNNVKKTLARSLEGLGIGSLIGCSVAGLVVGLAAMGSPHLIPALGIVLAGPIAAGLFGAGVGGITGGLLGALVAGGIPEERAKLYECCVKCGGVLLCVNTSDKDAQDLVSDWRDLKVQNLHH